jgi:hypothetical protein
MLTTSFDVGSTTWPISRMRRPWRAPRYERLSLDRARRTAAQARPVGPPTSFRGCALCPGCIALLHVHLHLHQGLNLVMFFQYSRLSRGSERHSEMILRSSASEMIEF